MPLYFGREAKQAGELDALLILPDRPGSVPNLPYGLLAIGQYLASRGYSAALLDYRNDPALGQQDLVDILARQRVRVAGVSIMSGQQAQAQGLLRLVRRYSPATLTCVGGVGVSADRSLFFEDADYTVRGEAELFMEQLLQGQLLPTRQVQTEPLPTLDNIPLPDRQVLETYARYWGGCTHIELLTSRGCPYTCGFCLERSLRTAKIRYAPVEAVVTMLHAVAALPGLRKVFFVDDIFTLHAARVRELTARMRAEGLDRLEYECFSHVKAAGQETYTALAGAGFFLAEERSRGSLSWATRGTRCRRCGRRWTLPAHWRRRCGFPSFSPSPAQRGWSWPGRRAPCSLSPTGPPPTRTRSWPTCPRA